MNQLIKNKQINQLNLNLKIKFLYRLIIKNTYFNNFLNSLYTKILQSNIKLPNLQFSLLIQYLSQQKINKDSINIKNIIIKNTMLRKASLQTTFLPAQTSLLTSIQRAKQKIFNKSINSQSQTKTSTYSKYNMQKPNDQNSSLQSNLNIDNSANNINSNYSFIDQIKQSRKIFQRPFFIDNNNSKFIPSKITQEKQQSRLKSQDLISNNSFSRISQTNQRIIVVQNKRERSSSNNLINSGNNNHSNAVVAHAMKVLQQKIIQLEYKNKKLQQKLVQSRIVIEEQKTNNKIAKQQPSVSNTQYHNLSTIHKPQSQPKQYYLLKQQCQSLQKQRLQLYEQLSKQKQLTKRDQGKRLNFHHQISQNISHVYEANNNQNFQQKCKEYQQTINKLQKQALHYKSCLQVQTKKNVTILNLHSSQIMKNQQLIVQIKQLKSKLKQMAHQQSKNRLSHNNKKNLSSRPSTSNQTTDRLSAINPQHKNAVSNTILKRKNAQLQNFLNKIKQQLQSQKINNKQKDNQINQLERNYIEVKQAFIGLYKDLLKYHPQVINSNMKFIFQRIRKNQGTMNKSRSILSSRFGGRFSQTKIGNSYNRKLLSAFRSKSGKKGLKMEDLDSSHSRSRERTNSGSRKSHKSNTKLTYRSPYAQQNLPKRNNRLKSAQSPNQKPYSRQKIRQSQQNKQKLNQIQKIIKQIKQVSRQIKQIKSQHRNLSVKICSQNNQQNDTQRKNPNQKQKNQQRMNQLTQQYNIKNAKLQELKHQKDRLAQQTVPQLIEV